MKLLFAGDIVLKKHSRKNGKKLLGKDLFRLVSEQDIACCDLECPIYTKDQVAIHKRGPSDYNESDSLERLSEAGFNMVTIANNHIMDYGISGLQTTIQELKNKRYRYVGAGMTEDEIYRIERIYDEESNIVIGVISVAETSFGTSYDGQPGCACFLGRSMERLLEEGKRNCDYLIVVCHGGVEELNVPLPEFRDVYRSYIDCGVDLVIAHHPHVIQGCERYEDKEIYYSLGNFAYDTDVPDEPYNPIGLCVCVDVDNKKMSTKAYTVSYADGQVEIFDSDKQFVQVCRLLQNDAEYIKNVNDYCIELYISHIRKYYADIVGLNIEDKDDVQKFAEHRLQGDDIKWDDLFVFHNALIESVRWSCKRAIISLGLLDKV